MRPGLGMKFGLLTLLASFALVAAVSPAKTAPASRQVSDILQSTPLIDGHNDLPWAIRETGKDLGSIDLTTDLRTGSPSFHTDLARMKAAGVGGQFWSVYVPSTLTGAAAFETVMEQIDLVTRMVEHHPQQLELALTATDIRRIHRSGKIASLIGVEGGHAIDDALALLRQLYAAGARYMTLTHNHNTAWADSATDVPTSGGLSPFGEEVVREMNRLGMMVDLSHSSREARLDALRVSESPVIFSHASAFSLVPHPQNVDDEILRGMKADGGLVMVTFVERFVSAEALAWRAAREAEEARQRVLHAGSEVGSKRAVDAWVAANPPARGTLAQVADHIEHVRRVAGIDHVGIGADFDGTPTLPLGLEGVESYPALLAELVRRGWTDADIRKLAGENLLRVLRETELVAARLKNEHRPSERRHSP